MSNSLHKAAVLLASLPMKQAASLLLELDVDQIEQVLVEIGSLTSVSEVERKAIFVEMAGRPPTNYLRIDAPTSSTRCFDFLQDVKSQDLVVLLVDEHPQTIALVVSYLPAPRAAKILLCLDRLVRMDVLARIAHMAQPTPETLQEVELGLEKRLSDSLPLVLRLAGRRYASAL